MLAGSRLVNEERRHLHYEAMAVDSDRLWFLVKELLNFGRTPKQTGWPAVTWLSFSARHPGFRGSPGSWGRPVPGLSLQ